MSPSQIRKMQERVSDKVEVEIAERRRILAEKKKQEEFRKATQVSGMSKADIGTARRAKKGGVGSG